MPADRVSRAFSNVNRLEQSLLPPSHQRGEGGGKVPVIPARTGGGGGAFDLLPRVTTYKPRLFET